MRILLTGGTGFIGRHLTQELILRGHYVVALVRDLTRASDTLLECCELRTWEDLPREYTFDAVVHLAGESIAGGRWTKENKQKILSFHLARET